MAPIVLNGSPVLAPDALQVFTAGSPSLTIQVNNEQPDLAYLQL